MGLYQIFGRLPLLYQFTKKVLRPTQKIIYRYHLRSTCAPLALHLAPLALHMAPLALHMRSTWLHLKLALHLENLDLVYFEELKVYEVCATVKPKLSLGPLKNSFTRVQETCCLLGRTADYDI